MEFAQRLAEPSFIRRRLRGCLDKPLDVVGTAACQQESHISAGIAEIVFFGSDALVQQILDVRRQEVDARPFGQTPFLPLNQ